MYEKYNLNTKNIYIYNQCTKNYGQSTNNVTNVLRYKKYNQDFVVQKI